MNFWDWFGDGSVMVAELGFACCAAEFDAAAAGRALVAEPGSGRVALVVSGTVTRALSDRLRDAVAAATVAGRAPAVVAFGACASSGGPYWDSAVVVAADEIVDVSAYVPGCAPTPDALNAALEELR